MRLRLQPTSVVVLTLSLLAPLAARGEPSAGKPVVLERHPVCEASAALVVPCSGGATGTCALVGDNEQDDAVFQYTIDADGRLAPAEPFEISLDDAEVEDIEALASDGTGVLVVGSHGRNTRCQPDDDRVAVSRLELDPRQAERIAGAKGFGDRTSACESRWVALPEDAPEGALSLRRGFCAAIASGEKAAKSGNAASCAGSTFDVEGAIVLPDGSGAGRLWLGLRAPQVQGYAVLLRVAPSKPGDKRLAFDGIAAIALRGKGIRELAAEPGWVWGIAGSAADGREKSQLFRFKAERLQSGNVIGDVELLAGGELPPNAEALIVQPEQRRAIVLLDGDEGEAEGACKQAAQQMTVDGLPE